MPDQNSEETFKNANNKIVNGKQPVRETLLQIQTGLQKLIKLVGDALAQADERAHASPLDEIQHQIQEARWNH